MKIRELRLQEPRGTYKAQRLLASEEAKEYAQASRNQKYPELYLLYVYAFKALQHAKSICIMSRRKDHGTTKDFVLEEVRLAVYVQKLRNYPNLIDHLQQWPKNLGIALAWFVGRSALAVIIQFTQAITTAIALSRGEVACHDETSYDHLQVSPKPDPRFAEWQECAIKELCEKTIRKPDVWPSPADIHKECQQVLLKLEDEYKKAKNKAAETGKVSLQGIIEVLKNWQKSKRTDKDFEAAKSALPPIAKTYDILCRTRDQCGGKTTDIIKWLGTAARDNSGYHRGLFADFASHEVIADLEKWQEKQEVNPEDNIHSSGNDDKNFEEVKKLMPNLLAEIRKDIISEGSDLVREFVLLPNNRVAFNSSKKRFVYFSEVHEHLQNKCDILEGYGYIDNVTVGNTPIYRMRDEFFYRVKNELHANKSKQRCITQKMSSEEDHRNIIDLLKKDYLLKTEDSLKEETARIAQDFISRGLPNTTACVNKQLYIHFGHNNKLIDHIIASLKQDFAGIPLVNFKEILFTVVDEEYKKLIPFANSRLVNAGLGDQGTLKAYENEINNKKQKTKQTIEVTFAIFETQKGAPEDERDGGKRHEGYANRVRKPWYKTAWAKIIAVLSIIVLITTLLINLKTIKEWFHSPRIQTSIPKGRLPLTIKNKLSVSLKKICEDIDNSPLAQQSDTAKRYVGVPLKEQELELFDIYSEDDKFGLSMIIPGQPDVTFIRGIRIYFSVDKNQYPELIAATRGFKLYVTGKIKEADKFMIKLSDVSLKFD